MEKLEIPKSIPKDNPYYKGYVDPFFTVLDYLIRKEPVKLHDVFAKRECAREMGVMPTLLLHPNVDLHFVEDVLQHGYDNELGRLARMAIALAEVDTPPYPHFQAVFDRFKADFEKRKPVLARLGEHNGPSSLDDMRFSEFAHAYDTYRVMVYWGAITPPYETGKHSATNTA